MMMLSSRSDDVVEVDAGGIGAPRIWAEVG